MNTYPTDKDQIRNGRKILSTKPLLPPLNELIPYLNRIWESGFITNCAAVHNEFEMGLCNHLGIKHISLLSNGTMALTMALKALDLKGRVITTPFTHIATAQAIHWNNLIPVFVDIDTYDLNMNIAEIERAITPDTCAILPVHLFGNPCKVEQIKNIANRYHLKVIYDAAHCFGVEYKGESVCNHGDMSVLSFHATKVFNCIEGGAIVCPDEATKNYIDALKNTGFNSDNQLLGYGLNAKMNEIQAAYGMVQLKYVNQAIEKRRIATQQYRQLLRDIKGISLLNEQDDVKYNYSYLPVIIDTTEFGASRDSIVHYLEMNDIFPEKYFSPLVSDYNEFSIFKTHEIPVAEKMAQNIICLPLSHEIQFEEINYVVRLLFQLQKRSKNELLTARYGANKE